MIYLVFLVVAIVCGSYLLKRRNHKDSINSEEVWDKTSETLDYFKKIMDNASIEAEEITNVQLKTKKDSPQYHTCPTTEHVEKKQKNEIKEMVLSRGINELTHFTRIENLQSILNSGLLSRLKLNERNQQLCVNDTMRLDNRMNGISLSVTHPNQSMFYKYRMKSNSDNWCVIILKPSVLWELSCLYCKHNAADSKMRYMSNDTLSTTEAFLSMFARDQYQSNLPMNYTTDVQAEVLCLDDISTEYIDKVVIQELHNEAFKNTSTTPIQLIADRKYFNTREYNLN